MLSIIIPSRNEIFLQKTIIDVLNKSTGEVEVFPILDSYEPPASELVDDPRVKYIRLPAQKYTQKRHGINLAVSISKGKYVMSLDAHCMLGEGFDEIIVKDLEDDWVAVPRRNRLDAKNWCIQTQSDTRPPIDYEYLMWPPQFIPRAFHGFKWDAKTLKNWDIKVDDTITMQASCWIMHKTYFNKMGFMQIEGYSGWGMEAEELCFSTWLTGGRVVTNKNTWYAHLHKGKEYGRMYFMTRHSQRMCNAFAYDFWINDRPLKNRIHNFEWLIDKFMPMPGWKKNWREELCT